MEEIDVSWEQVESAALRLSDTIKGSGICYQHIMAVARGGLAPALLLSHLLNIPAISAISLADLKSNSNRLIELCPARPEETLIVDEICGSGKTLQAINERLPLSDIAVLWSYPHALELYRSSGATLVTYHANTIPETHWLVFPWERLLQTQERSAAT